MKTRKQLFHGVLFVLQNFLRYKLDFFPFLLFSSRPTGRGKRWLRSVDKYFLKWVYHHKNKTKRYKKLTLPFEDF